MIYGLNITGQGVQQVPGRLQVLHSGGLRLLGQKSGVPHNFPYHMDHFAFSLSAVTSR